MRLFLLPISTRRSIIYCQKRIPTSPHQVTWLKNPIDKATTKSSETWLSWEKYKNGWRKKVTVYGNKLFQRLPFEEWGLKSVPPLTAKRREEELQGKIKSHMEYPGDLLEPKAAQAALQEYGSDDTQSYHRKWFWGTILGMPLSAPFALIPIIPNLPFFYLVFRAWSHWRARCGSEHIEFLVQNRLFELRPSSALDTAYAVSKMGVSVGKLGKEFKDLASTERTEQQTTGETSEPAEQMLLSKSDGILIADCLDIPELAPEVERAVWQIERSIKAQAELVSEKPKLESQKEGQTRQ